MRSGWYIQIDRRSARGECFGVAHGGVSSHFIFTEKKGEEMKTRNVLLAGLAVGILAAGAQAGDLYTIRTGDDMLRKFDTNTLAFTDIGTIGVPFDFGGMAWDSTNGKMYLVQGFAGTSLYTVDLGSGSATLVGNHGNPDVFSLAYDPTSDKLYAGLSTRQTGFFSVDRGSGGLNLIGNPGINLDGLTYDPIRGKVVGAYAGPGDLYDMDVSNGSGTLIYNGDFFNNCGVAYDGDTGLYWMLDWSGNMYSFDPGNGYARTLHASGLGAHDALSAAGPAQSCITLAVDPLVAGQSATWNVSGATAGEQVAVVYGFSAGSTVVNGFAGYCASFGIQGVNQNKVICTKSADGNGDVSCKKSIPAGVRGRRVLSQAAERNTCPNECVSNLDDQVVG